MGNENKHNNEVYWKVTNDMEKRVRQSKTQGIRNNLVALRYMHVKTAKSLLCLELNEQGREQ